MQKATLTLAGLVIAVCGFGQEVLLKPKPVSDCQPFKVVGDPIIYENDDGDPPSVQGCEIFYLVETTDQTKRLYERELTWQESGRHRLKVYKWKELVVSPSSALRDATELQPSDGAHKFRVRPVGVGSSRPGKSKIKRTTTVASFKVYGHTDGLMYSVKYYH
jgi:hypothetical protein